MLYLPPNGSTRVRNITRNTTGERTVRYKPSRPNDLIRQNVKHFAAISLLFVQLMYINYYKIVKQLKSFKIIIVAPTCFGLHKPSSGSSQPLLR